MAKKRKRSSNKLFKVIIKSLEPHGKKAKVRRTSLQCCAQDEVEAVEWGKHQAEFINSKNPEKEACVYEVREL